MEQRHSLTHISLQLATLLLLLAVSFAVGALGDIACVLLIAVIAHHLAPGVHISTCRILGTWLLLMILSGFADQALQRFFGRPLDVKYDVFLLPALKDLSITILGALPAAALLFFLFAIAAGAIVLIGRALRHAVAPTQGQNSRVVTAGVSLVIGSCFLLSLLSQQVNGHTQFRSLPFLTGLSGAVEIIGGDKTFNRRLAQTRSEDLLLPSALSRLRGRDVVIVFVESYGRLLWDDNALQKAFAPRLESSAEQLAKAGYLASSRFVTSSVAGGGSWFAHMTFMSGVRCGQQLCWESLLASEVRALPHFFADHGYETVSVLPAMDIDAWPEGAWYGYSRDIWTRELDYDGWKYGWSPMPDQFVWLRLDESLFSTLEKPVFAEVALTSSHMPFGILPPYHRRQWEREALEETLRSAGTPSTDSAIWLNPKPADYLAAVTYSLRSTWDFISTHYERDGIIVVLGDHQPPLDTGTESDISQSHRNDVPMHVISKDPGLHELLEQQGFGSGLFPDEHIPAMPMEAIKSWLLQLLNTPENQLNDL